MCPTLGVAAGTTPPPPILEMIRRIGVSEEARAAEYARLHRAGVTIVSGVDSGITPAKPHGILARAVASLARGGMPGADALASATSVAARVCGVGDRTGRLAPGLAADLLVADGDPVTDPGALERVRLVVRRGREVSPVP